MWKIRDHRLKSYVIYQELPCRKKKDCFTWLRGQRQDDRVEEYELTSLYEKWKSQWTVKTTPQNLPQKISYIQWKGKPQWSGRRGTGVIKSNPIPTGWLSHKLYCTGSPTRVRLLSHTVGSPAWGSGNMRRSPHSIWLWRPVGFDHRTGANRISILGGHTQGLVHVRTREAFGGGGNQGGNFRLVEFRYLRNQQVKI